MTERKQEGMENPLYHGDNLDILRRHLADESVDLSDLAGRMRYAGLPCDDGPAPYVTRRSDPSALFM
jgi:hypothetical protein